VPPLVVLAAGLGTRFHGLKQLARVGPGDDAIIDHLLRRASRCGFDRGIVVVRPEIAEEVGDHLTARGRPLPIDLVVQPEPKGTAHAVLMCRDVIDGAFAVANADDLYPAEAFSLLIEHLEATHENTLVAFRVDRTLVNDRPVSRAAIQTDAERRLVSITEQKVTAATAGREWVSMNLWGFRSDALDIMARVVREHVGPGEVLLPDVGAAMVAAGDIVRVLRCDQPCIGITYAEDVDAVRGSLE